LPRGDARKRDADAVPPSDTSPRLARRLSFPLLVLYGLGTTIGAGIYALVGVSAGIAGYWMPVAFVLAGVLAGFTALCLAELSGRFPHAAGEAAYVEAGFGRRDLAVAVGLSMVVAGTISAATVSRGFAGYVSSSTGVPEWGAILCIVAVSGAVAARGIGETAWLAAGLTVLEVGGLLLVIWVGRAGLAELPARAAEVAPPLYPAGWSAILGASVICFYAFLGFEDMINVAEEVRDVRRTLPRAIVWTLACTLALYLMLTLVAVATVAPDELAKSDAPLALIYERATGRTPWLLTTIGAIAMSNGALIQIVKSSRILYGLADRGALPGWLGRIHPRSHTPLPATALVVVLVAALALALPLAQLARATSLITLVVFALICGALVRVRGARGADADGFRVPIGVAWLGLCVNVGLVAFETLRLLGLGGASAAH